MKRYLIPVTAILVLASVLLLGCGLSEADLAEKDREFFSFMGFEVGYSWGYFHPTDAPVDWVTPDRYEDFDRELYVPKGYQTQDDWADARFPDGAPLNKKQKKQGMDSYNWGFYAGFRQGVDDNLHDRPYLCAPNEKVWDIEEPIVE